MCGICGRLNFEADRPVDAHLLARMSNTLFHRGPDDGGVFTDGAVGLGARRLAVIDLSPKGHQPLSNEDGSIWIVFNGEIYNFVDLREDLIKRGHVFRSKTDTETVVHLYEQFGPNCVQHLRGMFAFAIWDRLRRRLFLARDRIGKKPLFYRHTERGFWFASEIKAIIEDPEIERNPDFTAIHHYLAFQSVPAPWSAFDGIKKLPPAHWLMVENGKVTVERYWSLSFSQKRVLRSKSDEEEIACEVRSTLEEATRIRMISDVPLGAFLSGGVDSSAVVALMALSSAQPIKTFSIGFDHPSYTETRFARLMAERYHTDHRELVVRPKAIEVLPQLVWHYNEPFADSSAVPTFYVSKLAREFVTVALNGDGGDETFGGYDRYFALALASRMRWLESLLPIAWPRKLAEALPREVDPKTFWWRARRFLQDFGEPLEERYFNWNSYFTNKIKSELYTPEFSRQQSRNDSLDLLRSIYRSADAQDFIDRTLQVDGQTYLPDTLLVKADIASMANSLEARSPLLDHKVMELAASLPISLKLHGRMKKYILKRAMRSLLPAEILARPKMGFGVPLAEWLRDELKDFARDLLLSPRFAARGLFRPEAVKRILEEHVAGRWNWQYPLWSLLMLELWFQMFIDQPTSTQERKFVQRNLSLAAGNRRN
jgi:asparagine synthase (glutamine-hydrolysing)